MKNPFLQLLEDPAHLITVEFDKAERETIVRMLEEKINNAMAEYKNPEQHDYYTGKGAMGFAYNEWLHYLDTRWDGKLNRTFEMFAEGVGLQRNELYKMIIGLLLDKHLDYVCEHETNIDDDTLNALRINKQTDHKVFSDMDDDIDSQFDYHSSDEYWENGDTDDDMDEDNFCIMTGAC